MFDQLLILICVLVKYLTVIAYISQIENNVSDKQYIIIKNVICEVDQNWVEPCNLTLRSQYTSHCATAMPHSILKLPHLRLQEEINDVKEKWNRHIAEISRENVTRDLELGTALEEQRRMKLELEQRKDDLQR